MLRCHSTMEWLAGGPANDAKLVARVGRFRFVVSTHTAKSIQEQEQHIKAIFKTGNSPIAFLVHKWLRLSGQSAFFFYKKTINTSIYMYKNVLPSQSHV